MALGFDELMTRRVMMYYYQQRRGNINTNMYGGVLVCM